MPTFADAVTEADATGLPVVEGFAVQAAPGSGEATRAAVEAKLAALFPKWAWTSTPVTAEWFTVRSEASREAKCTPTLGEAWDAVRQLKRIPGVSRAEPLLLAGMPVTNGSDAQQAFKLWGKINEDRLAQIKAQSDSAHIHWSLQQMQILDADGAKGAWTIWREKHGNESLPGTGVLVAHPDTGYTRHARVLPHLEESPGHPGKYGRNFVERDLNQNPEAPFDGMDPMQDRSLGNFPGHGTGTASIIAAAAAPEDPIKPGMKAWGVAPGAKILPLRVSSSVIHLSFQNVCDAFVEAMARNAHVISMSLGGPLGSDLLNFLVQKALNQGIIIVAAAGNYVPTVGFPARIPGVIACAASNALNAPWRFSGMGAEVDITAPGELVWHDVRRIKTVAEAEEQTDDQDSGNGTSFATANVAGLAALWLSYYGREELIRDRCKGQAGLLPFLFQLCLQRSANSTPPFLKGGKGGFGAGIANAAALLLEANLPSFEDANAERSKILSEPVDGVVHFPVGSWWNILTLPTLAANGDVVSNPTESAARRQRITQFVADVVGTGCTEEDQKEINALAATNPDLQSALDQVGRSARRSVSTSAVRRYLLRDSMPLSSTLGAKMGQARKVAQSEWCSDHPELNVPYRTHGSETGEDKNKNGNAAPYQLPFEDAKKTAYAIAPPPVRRLRVYALDPSLATRLDSAAINEITIPVVFERDLLPGPVGDYLEVVDVDPASDCAYAPVNLNHPFLLAQDGLPRSEGNPQFHQQMVYAVAMETIGNFEQALGRPIFWSPLRPWNPKSGDRNHVDCRARDEQGELILKDDRGHRIRKDARGASILTDGSGDLIAKDPEGNPILTAKNYEMDLSDRFIQRLRLYPHALREQNAYYSPQKRAILFGYFPSGNTDPGVEYPGGVVFTCLAHDIIAHEMTHAILDGMHVHFTEPSNPDVFAFHEAFADIVALFQRFTYPELLRSQIATARGRLDAGTLMSQLALQFGQATGRHQAMRDALGHVVAQTRARDTSEWRDRRKAHDTTDEDEEAGITIADSAQEFDEVNRLKWKRFQADPSLLAQVEEPHERGSFLVAAVFDAYLAIYEDRIADLRRIATGGTGILPDGDMHPDLVNRMADEAAKSARHVLKMCIRAMDYVPPTDITFGEFLRALITADSDLIPDDTRRYRVAFIEAFRKWGIYPRDVQTLSEDSLRWTPPANNKLFPAGTDKAAENAIRMVRRALLGWKPGQPREKIWGEIIAAQGMLNNYIKRADKDQLTELLCSIDLSRSFQVTNLRPARRIGPNGEFLTEMVVEIIQDADALPNDPEARKAEMAEREKLKQEREHLGDTELPNKLPANKIPFRGGCTLIVNMDEYTVRYVIHKSIDSATRQARQREFMLRAGGTSNPDAAEYSSQDLPAGWYTQDAVRANWLNKRNSDREAMRASSCDCRRSDMESQTLKAAAKSKKTTGIAMPDPILEPFALLHQP